jgi:hypothetical protein
MVIRGEGEVRSWSSSRPLRALFVGGSFDTPPHYLAIFKYSLHSTILT